MGEEKPLGLGWSTGNNMIWWGWDGSKAYKMELINFKPKQIIQREDSKTTILIWEDDSKTIVQCSEDEKFVPEFGIAMATMNKIYGSRNQFLKFINKKTFWQDKDKKEK